MNNDRRTSFRCASPASQEPAILRAGRKDVSALVLEESAEGMGVRIEGGSLPLKTDDLVQIITASRRVSAQIVYAREEEQGQRLGLMKLRDLGFAPSHSNRSLLRRASGAGASFMRFSMALAVCLGMFLGGVVLPIDWHAVGLKSAGASASTAAPLSPLANSTSSRQAVSKQSQLADTILRLDDLSSEEFARLMKLSPSQQDRIGRIVDETISVMSLLHANRGQQSDEAWAEMGMQTLHASWRQIQLELTPEQQAKWRELTSS